MNLSISLPRLIILIATLSSAAAMELDHSNAKAFDSFMNGFGISGYQNPCSYPGVLCEKMKNSNVFKITRIEFNSRRLSGGLSPAIGILSELRELSLANNLIVDEIPSSLMNCRKLEVLDLRNNKLSGKIPVEFQSLIRLRVLDLSANNLTGSFQFQLPGRNKRYVLAENSAQNSTSLKEKKKKNKVRNWILGFVVGGVGGMICGVILSFVVKMVMAGVKGGRKDSGPTIYSPLIKREHLEFLEREDWLTSMEIVGSGGCGQVYRASLPVVGNKMVAIKKISQFPTQTGDLSEEDSKMMSKKMRQIRAEINTVGRIRHRNLVPLLAHVPGRDCHYLVYEYMKNGSLMDVLKRVDLDWVSRHRIAMGIAAGLEYLHSSHSEQIIHRDLKPANILIDDNMEARITDFGLAKTMSDAHTHVTTSNVAGTIGYIAPEYHQSLRFTDKCDIYSFGVVLGALVMGKEPSDEFLLDTSEVSMVNWMRNTVASGNGTMAIDSSLLGNGYEEQMLLVLKIACFCTMEDPKERPSSKQARLMLDQIKH